MPKLITTRTRIADLGKPRIIIIREGNERLEGFKTQTVMFDKYNLHCFQNLLYQAATSGLETSSIDFSFRKRTKNDDFFFRTGDITHTKRDGHYIDKSNRLITACPKDGVN